MQPRHVARQEPRLQQVSAAAAAADAPLLTVCWYGRRREQCQGWERRGLQGNRCSTATLRVADPATYPLSNSTLRFLFWHP